MDTFFLEEARVWLRHKEQLLPSTVTSCDDASLVLTTDYGKVIYLQKAEINRETVYPMHPSSIHGAEDMSTLAELHEAAIMHNLFLRYQKDNIYTNIGSILAAVNPYKQIAGLYDGTAVDLYSKHQMGSCLLTFLLLPMSVTAACGRDMTASVFSLVEKVVLGRQKAPSCC